MKTIKPHIQIITLVFLSIFVVSTVNSQNLIWKYANSATDGVIDNMLTDSVGNIYVSGTFYKDEFVYQGSHVTGITGNNESNVFLLKMAPTGRLIWLHSIRSQVANVNILPGKIAINQRGELVSLFTIDSQAEYQIGDYTSQTEGLYNHTLITKISKTGFIFWTHELITIPDSFFVIDSPDIFMDEDGSAYVAGSFEGDELHISDQVTEGTGADAMIFLSKILHDGTVEWLHNCNYDTGGDNGEIYATHIANSRSDIFYIGGYMMGSRRFVFGTDSIVSTTEDDAFLARYTKDGTAHWGRSFYGDSDEYMEKLIVAKNEDVFISGVSNSNPLNVGGNIHPNVTGNFNLFIGRYSPSGDLLKSTSIPIEKSVINANEDNAFIGIDGQDNLVVCSDFYSTAMFSIPYTLSNPDAGSDMMMAKLDGVSLDPLWTMQGASAGDNYYEGISITNEGDIYFAGTAYDKLDIDTETIEENPTDGSPYLVKISTGGNLDYLYSQANSGPNRILAKKVASDKYGNTYVTGNFIGPANVLDDIGLVQPGDSGMFIARYTRVHDVSGRVLDSIGVPVSQGYVKIYGYTLYQRSPLNDSVELNVNGEYAFQDIPYGNYILVAVPDEALRADFVPSYYPSYEYWEFAEQVNVDPTSVTNNLDIHLQPITHFEGITQVGGQVQDAEEIDLKSTFPLKAKPKKKATAVLAGQKSYTKSTYEVVATTETDEDGNFAFYGIENGGYYLWIDMPGLPIEDAYFIEVSGHQYVSSLDYLVTEEEIIQNGLPIYSSIDNATSLAGISVYPNPAKDILMIEMENSSLGIYDLYDASGKLLEHNRLKSKTQILDVSNYPAGNYILRIITDEIIVFKKIDFIR